MKFRMNPMYKKELKISVRTVRMAIIILGYNLVLALIGLVSFYYTFNYQNYYRVQYTGILDIYLILAVIEFGLVLFVVPAFTASAISGEREKQTLEILLTTKLKPSQIIFGKLLSSISSTLLLVLSSLPILALVFSIGGIRLIDLIHLMLFCGVSAVFVGSIGIFFSTFFKRTVPATVFSYGTIIVLIVGTLAAVFVTYQIILQNYDTAYMASSLNALYNPPDIGNGILVLLINPAVSLVALLSSQFGSPSYLNDLLGTYGSANNFITSHWYVISLIVQMTAALILLLLSVRKLNPLKK